MIGEILELRQLLKNRKLSSDELEDLQRRKLRAVIRHSYEKVPYYRSLFRSAGLSPGDIRTVGDLKHIPITTKDDLRAAGVKNIITEGVNLSSCSSAVTSGSTGKPFTVYRTRRDLRTHLLVAFRALLSMGFRPQDRLAILGMTSLNRARLYQRLGLYRSVNIHPLLSIEEQIRRLQEMNPTVLWVYPSVLRALLDRIGYRLSKIIRPRALITSAEVFDEVIKEKILADLDVERFNFYGSIETGRIAAECPAHDGLHVNVDHVILECLDGVLPVKHGKSGVSILTSLNNFTMPLIRYRLGDICMFLKKECSCGSHFPLIGPPRGRELDVIRLPSGKLLPPIGFNLIIESIGDVDQYRIIQERIDHLVIQIIYRGTHKDETFLKLKSRIIEHLGESIGLNIQTVDFIKEENLKFRTFISKLPKSDI